MTMMTNDATPFPILEKSLGKWLLDEGRFVDTKSWQAQDVSQRPEMTPRELIAVTIVTEIPETIDATQAVIEPNLPWAEEHFLERVSGVPLNPPPSHERWPFAQAGNSEHMQNLLFSHTYPERFWPKRVGHMGQTLDFDRMGIRFGIGDLDDVVKMLLADPHTRQAYLPVFFPEDTGKTQVRIPCTIGYQFLIREGRLHIIYTIRSCDFLRHFRDDVYMAMRLAQWVCQEVNTRVFPEHDSLPYNILRGNLYMNIGSLHVFQGDMQLMKVRYGK